MCVRACGQCVCVCAFLRVLLPDMDELPFARFFRSMLERGINLAPSGYEAGFMSLAHTSSDINKTVRAAYESFREIK